MDKEEVLNIASIIQGQVDDLEKQQEFWHIISGMSDKDIFERLKCSDTSYKNPIERYRGKAYGKFIVVGNQLSWLKCLLNRFTEE